LKLDGIRQQFLRQALAERAAPDYDRPMSENAEAKGGQPATDDAPMNQAGNVAA